MTGGMKGGDRRLRKQIISYKGEGKEWIPYEAESLTLIRNIKCILHLAQTGLLQVAFKSGKGNKQISVSDPSRYYLKLKKISIKPGSEDLYRRYWSETGLSSSESIEATEHYSILVLLCVKGVFVNGDLELNLCSCGCPIDRGTARVLIPDPIYKVYYRLDDPALIDRIAYLNSAKTNKLEMNEKDKVVELLEFLAHNDFNLNEGEELGPTVRSSEEFSTFVMDLFSDYTGYSLHESLQSYAEKTILHKNTYKIAKYLSTEFDYYKDNKPEIAKLAPCENLSTDEGTETPKSTKSYPSPQSDGSDVTVVGQNVLSSDEEQEQGSKQEVEERCLRDPCLKIIFEKLEKLQGLQVESKGSLKKKKRKKNKTKRKKKKTKKRKTKRRTKKRTKKRTHKKKKKIY